MVQQDAFLFTTSIENNIAYGNPWAQRAAHRAAQPNTPSCTTTSSGCPRGYTTVVGERGVSLSGGQRQRLTIARSLMLRPSVLVFDDSTAAIDAGTEQRIRTAMKRFARDRVTLIISHRLSSLMHADQILFVEDGRIVERGTHEELLALGGRYRALYDLQLRPDDDRPTASREPRDVDAERRRRRKNDSGRPTKAVVGSHRDEEEVFGKAYDPRIVRRIWSFVKTVSGPDLHLGRRGAGVHADAAGDPADHPLRHRQRHDGRRGSTGR